VVDSLRLPRHRHGRWDDREKESPWPWTSLARPRVATPTNLPAADRTAGPPRPAIRASAGVRAGRPTPRGAGGLLAAPGGRVPDWLLVGILAAAIGQLFGVEIPTRSSVAGDNANLEFQPAPGPFILVGLAYFTYFHATVAGRSIGNKIMGIRVLDAGTGRPLPYVRAFVRALMSSLSALRFFLGYLWMLWEPRKRTWHDIVADSLVVRTTDRGDEFGRPVR
jgi:uncharacterized RDD family membrane protein YckC